MSINGSVSVQLEDVGLCFRRGRLGVTALDHVWLNITAGEFLVVNGRSGSGKTTLLQVIAGLLPATSGCITVCGRQLTAMRDAERARFRRRNLGIVFQSFNLLPELTAAENVALPLLLDGVPAARVDNRVTEVLNQVGLGQRRHHLPDELSGGECQRVAVARALVSGPAVVLADEPTGNLDPESGGQVLDLLRDANRALGCTVVLVTHDSHALGYGTRTVHLDSGQLVAPRNFHQRNAVL